MDKLHTQNCAQNLHVGKAKVAKKVHKEVSPEEDSSVDKISPKISTNAARKKEKPGKSSTKSGGIKGFLNKVLGWLSPKSDSQSKPTGKSTKNESPPSCLPRSQLFKNGDNISDSSNFFKKHNNVEPLFYEKITPEDKSDSIFPQIEKMMSEAKKSIQVEMYMFDKKNLIDLMIDQAHKGVKVQVIVDPPNEGWEADKAAAMEKMRANGIEVVQYPTKSSQINHVKMLIVDGDHAIIGGMNWGEVSPRNHDFDVKVDGPGVDDMEYLFRNDWIVSGGKEENLPKITETKPHRKGDAMVNLVTSGGEIPEKNVGKTIVSAISHAKKSVHAELFCLTDTDTLNAMKEAHDRGVDVRVILEPLNINGFSVNKKAANFLARNGIPVRWYNHDYKTGEKLHGKMGLIDNNRTILGSSNWTNAGFRVNREADVEVISDKVNSKFDEIFEYDWKNRSSEHMEAIPGFDDHQTHKPNETETE